MDALGSSLLPEELAGGFGGEEAGPAAFGAGGPPPPQPPSGKAPKGLLKRAWFVARMLYRNPFTR